MLEQQCSIVDNLIENWKCRELHVQTKKTIVLLLSYYLIAKYAIQIITKSDTL